MDKQSRFREAYLAMGFSVDEASRLAKQFDAEENKDRFYVGCSDFETNRAFVWTIEAARALAWGAWGDKTALKLLNMAVQDVKRTLAVPERRAIRKSIRKHQLKCSPTDLTRPICT